MNINDVVVLAKAGYKVNEIKELMALEPKAPEKEPEKESEKEPDEKPDFDALLKEKENRILELQKQIDEGKKALEIAQNQNKNQNMAGEGTDDVEVLTDFVKSFM